MSALSSLKLVATKKPHSVSPVLYRRNKLSNKIWEQIQFAQAQQEGKSYAPTKFKTIRDKESGSYKQVEYNKRVKPWWFIAENGKVCIAVRYGARLVELAKGKPSVEVANAEELIKALTTIKVAVENGELDAQIELASAKLKEGFKPK